MRWLLLGVLTAATVLAGDFQARYELTLNRVLNGGPPTFDDAFVLADLTAKPTRRFTDFSGDVSGRYIGALASAAEYSGETWPALDRIVREVIRLQKPDGHFGAPLSEGKVVDSDMATLWGNGRILIGLLEYYRLNESPDVLEASRKLGDFLVSVAPRFNAEQVRREYNGERFAVGYICWTQNLEGIVELYRHTKDQRYLDLARSLADRVDRHESQHSHGFLTSVRGVLELYRVTHEQRYLDQAEREWRGVIDSGNLLAGGAVPEMFAPAIKRDEGCSEADWLRLSLGLWQVTRKPEYLRQAELTLFNEFELNQFATGDFGHHTLTGEGMEPPYARAWWCCTFHGLRAMVAVFRNVFQDRDGVIAYDLPVEGHFESAGLSLRAESNLGVDASVKLTIAKADGSEHAIAVRAPEWAAAVTVSVEGKETESAARDGYVSVSRAWQTGEEIEVKYEMTTRVVRNPQSPARVGVFHGPWMLAVDEETSPNFFDEPSTSNVIELYGSGDVRLERAPAVGSAPPFSVPVANFRLKYLPGGYPMQPATALLRPMAEFTNARGLGRIQYWFPLRPGADRLDANYKP